MDDFEGAFPREIVNRATRSGDELVLALEDARDAIRIADQNLIAVLGVEVFRFLYGGQGWKPLADTNSSLMQAGKISPSLTIRPHCVFWTKTASAKEMAIF